MIRHLIIKWFINSLALGVTSLLFKGIFFNDLSDLLLASIIFGILNTFMKPILLFLTLPINILTLGIFTFIINGIILWITSLILTGFVITSFLSAIGGALVISIVSIILNKTIKEDKRYK
jgi:putative membrane protein